MNKTSPKTSNTEKTIVATSNTPSFAFAPPMQTGVVYYLAAMAGNNNGGNVDLADPCLDFSNANPIIWRPLPSVTLSVPDPNLCAGGCATLAVSFSGTAPFTLTYATPPPAVPVTQFFPGYTGSLLVCSPTTAPVGSWLVQATALSDAYCTCSQ